MHGGVALGALIATSFGLVWAIAGVQSVIPRWRLAIVGVSVLTTILICATLISRVRSGPPPTSPAGTFNGPIYGLAVGFETIAIVAAIIGLRRTDRKQYILPAVALIVGLHFFGLARAMNAVGFVWVAGAMSILATAIIFGLARSLVSSAQAAVLTGFGCAAILWISAAWTLVKA